MRAYLDHNATAPLRPAALAGMQAALVQPANPSSVHAEGRRARALMDGARTAVAGLVGATAEQVVFTSGATEANRLALAGLGRRAFGALHVPVLATTTAHDSIREGLLPDRLLPVDGAGRLRLDTLAAALSSLPQASPGVPRAIVAVLLANNETGVIDAVVQAAEIAHAHGALLHCDAVQAAGRIPIDIVALGADSLALSAHKLGGPAGAGALVLRPGVMLAPLYAGGGQERGMRPGTENVAAIAGFGAAAVESAAALAQDTARLTSLRDRLESGCVDAAAKAGLPAVSVSAHLRQEGAALLPNTLSLALPGADSHTQVMALDLDGVAVSAGAACSSGKVRTSHVLAACGLAPEITAATIRLSLGWSTTVAEIDHAIAAYGRMAARLAARATRIAVPG